LISALLHGQLTWNLPLLCISVFLIIVYFYYSKRNPSSIPLRKPLFFLAGISLLYLAIGSPLLAISHLSFSFHMIQMSILYFIVPPLILLGIPASLAKDIGKIGFIKRLSPYWISPKGALIAFSILFLSYHLPFLLHIISQDPMLKMVYTSMLFLLAFQMIWPLASPIPEKRLMKQAKTNYLIKSSIYIMPACLLFIVSAFFADMNNPFLAQAMTDLCLPAGHSIQVLPPPFNTKYDQILSGVFMLGLHKFGLVFVGKVNVTQQNHGGV